MPPRIRSFLPRLPFARARKSSAPEAPSVFREFVETLQRLDAGPRPSKRAGAERPARRRRYAGNGVRRPPPRRRSTI